MHEDTGTRAANGCMAPRLTWIWNASKVPEAACYTLSHICRPTKASPISLNTTLYKFPAQQSTSHEVGEVEDSSCGGSPSLSRAFHFPFALETQAWPLTPMSQYRAIRLHTRHRFLESVCYQWYPFDGARTSTNRRERGSPRSSNIDEPTGRSTAPDSAILASRTYTIDTSLVSDSTVRSKRAPAVNVVLRGPPRPTSRQSALQLQIAQFYLRERMLSTPHSPAIGL